MLKGRRIALLETRMSEEAVALVERLGGAPYSVPAVREVSHGERTGSFFDLLTKGQVSVVVFLTGSGVSVLLKEAARLGRLKETLAAIRRTIVACRGAKPVGVLGEHDVPVQLVAAEPHTTKELLESLDGLDLRGRTVALVHHGEPNLALAAALTARGARVEELSLYEWTLPEDLGPLKRLVQDLIDGRVDAIAFTNEVQCRHLFRVADQLSLSDRLSSALNDDVIVAAVGPVCAEGLRRFGITPDVIPARPRMASMIAALADYFELTEGLMGEG
jgi:uroporphyrinogen-III synthase